MLRFDPFRELDRPAPQMGRPRSIMAFDAIRDDDKVVVYFDVPGVSADDLDVKVEKNELTVTAERRWNDDDQRVIASERPQGSFTRQLMLSDALDMDKLEADLADGVLTVTIPVAESSKERRIKVRSGGEGQHSAIETSGSEKKSGTEKGSSG